MQRENTAQVYGIWLCPFCREQIETDDYDPYGHEHDGVRYPPVRVSVEWSVAAVDLDAAVQDAQEEERRAEEERQADKAELARLEAEWRPTAPASQVAAYEKQRARESAGLANFAAVLKETWGGSMVQQMMEDANRESAAMFFGSEEDKAEARRTRLANERARLESTLALFTEKGPAAVPFWKLRDTKRKLADLDAPDVVQVREQADA